VAGVIWCREGRARRYSFARFFIFCVSVAHYFYDKNGAMNPTLEAIRAAAAGSGLNLVAATPADRYDAAVKPEYSAAAIAPGARSIIVIGNGGAAFWSAFKRHGENNSGWMARDNPFDDFTRTVVERDIAPLLAALGIAHTIIYPFLSTGPTLSFMAAGKAAGLSGPSLLGVMVHPVYGPWIAFRAAILVNELIDAPGVADGFDPCPSCTARTCISACPAEAVSLASGWDIPKCLTHRVEVEADCAPRCHARAGCVLGPEHRYADDELAYHQMRSLRAMRPYYEANIKPGRS
jgi:epoxyqueuosine reductase